MFIKKNQFHCEDEVVVIGRENFGKIGTYSYQKNGVAFVRLDNETEFRPYLLRNIQKTDYQLEIDFYQNDLYLIRLLNLLFNF